MIKGCHCLEIQSLHHVSILVTDLERAKTFYKDVLGLEPTTRPPLTSNGVWYQIGDAQIHLIQYPEKALKPRPIDTSDAHFALRVDDYDKTVARLKELNVPIVERPDSLTGWPQVYCQDPDGNVIELNAERRK